MAIERQPTSQKEPSAPSAEGARYEAIFLEIQNEWNKAEEAIKRAEQIALDVSIPAITELRYAGRRIVDALTLATGTGDNEDKVLAHLEDARFCCHRAQHDAIDAALAKIGIDLNDLTTRLGFDPVIKAYPGFQEFYAEFAVTRDKIAASRANRLDRTAIYDSVTATDLPSLIKGYEKVLVMRPMAKAFSLQMRLGSGIGIAALIATIIAATFAGLAVPWDKWL